MSATAQTGDLVPEQGALWQPDGSSLRVAGRMRRPSGSGLPHGRSCGRRWCEHTPALSGAALERVGGVAPPSPRWNATLYS